MVSTGSDIAVSDLLLFFFSQILRALLSKAHEND